MQWKHQTGSACGKPFADVWRAVRALDEEGVVSSLKTKSSSDLFILDKRIRTPDIDD